MAEPLRLVFVGCGAIARTWAEALRQVPGIELVATVDPDPAARAAIDPTVAGCDSIDALWQHRVPFDAALVATPPDRHEDLATRLLGAGAHVLCEKPLATSPTAAARMQHAAMAAGRQLMLGSKFRYTPAATAARELLQAQRLGRVHTGEVVFGARVDMRQRWNARRTVAGGGVLMDNGSHAADLVRCLLGPIAQVAATCLPTDTPHEVETTATVQFATTSGVLVHVLLTWSFAPEVPYYLRLCGVDGTLELGWQQARWKRHDGAWQPLAAGYDKVGAFRAQLEDFASACRGHAPRLDLHDALAAVQVVDTAYRAAAARRWLDVAPTA